MRSGKALLGLDKVGAAGALLAAAAAPCCFPLLAAVGGALGLGALHAWRGYMGYAIQGFVLLSLAGNTFAFRLHRKAWPLALGLAGAALILFAYYVSYEVILIYTGLAGLAVSALGNIIAKQRRGASCPPVLRSLITCPRCGHQKEETMPTDACLYFYECQNCHTMLRPKAGDCCVFCSYGSIKCPPTQAAGGCCAT